MKVDNTYKIDFVITWLDGNDPNWKKEHDCCSKKINKSVDNSEARYRNWDLLRYWFRGVEKYAPWVNNIYFVTWGHIPCWLNVSHPKLKVVKHEDFIPSEYLPLFNSCAIEFFFNRIKGLSDRFVYFNDDFFLIDSVKPDRFFKNGLPCDIGSWNYVSSQDGLHGCTVFSAIDVLNKHFDKREVTKKTFSKWFNLKYPKRSLVNLQFLMAPFFVGFLDHHLPQGYLKSTFDNVWEFCGNDVLRTCRNKFKSYEDVHIWLVRYWQLASGKFTPYNVMKDGMYYDLSDKSMDTIVDLIKYQKKKIIVLNDNQSLVRDFENDKEKLLYAFNYILPNKSSFEL